MSIYKYLDYKKALKSDLLEKKRLNQSLTFEKMALACRVQKTYLSKVLNREGDLSADQLYGASEYLGHLPNERDFLFLLHQYNSSVHPKRRQDLLTSIEKIQAEQLRTEAHLKVKMEKASPLGLQMYYLDPHLQLVHMFLTIERFQKNPSQICNHLPGLTAESLQDKLTKLQSLQIISWNKSKNHWQVDGDDLHLSAESPLFPAYRTLLRMKAMEKLSAGASERSYSLSVVLSSNEKVRQQIQAKFLKLLKEAQELVQGESETEVYQMNFDLFAWS